MEGRFILFMVSRVRVQGHCLYCIKPKGRRTSWCNEPTEEEAAVTPWKPGSRERDREKSAKRYHPQEPYPSDLLLPSRSHLQSFQYPNMGIRMRLHQWAYPSIR